MICYDTIKIIHYKFKINYIFISLKNNDLQNEET